MAEPTEAEAAAPTGVDPKSGEITDRDAAVSAGVAIETPPEIPFAAFLQTLRRGVVHEELGRELRELIQDVRLHHKKGVLTFTLTVEPVGTRGQVTIIDDIKIKAPVADRATQTFWSDQIGNLLTSDPEGDLFQGGLREVPPVPETREVPQP